MHFCDSRQRSCDRVRSRHRQVVIRASCNCHVWKNVSRDLKRLREMVTSNQG